MTNASAKSFADALTSAMSTIVNTASDLVTPSVGRVIAVAPGEMVAWDDCCDGQLWARLVNLLPVPTAVPRSQSAVATCSSPFFIATLELGITRCAATSNAQGTPPSASQIVADGLQSLSDMAQLLAALKCSGIDVRTLSEWTPQGPEGGCHGGYWTFTIRLNNCLTCPEPEPEPEPEPDPDDGENGEEGEEEEQ